MGHFTHCGVAEPEARGGALSSLHSTPEAAAGEAEDFTTAALRMGSGLSLESGELVGPILISSPLP